jgi:histidinol-phosphate/aromatic aminotransferase/cobyric acid decarboxylase-like protein/choline kinase
MQAIILAAGMGRRLGAYTQNNTKCMVEVNGVSLIDRVLGQLSTLHLTRVLIVVGYKGKELVEYIGHRFDDRLKIEYADNPVYDKTNNIYSLSLVKEQLQEDDTLLIESDLIFDDALFRMIVDDPYPNLALVAKYETWMDGTMVQIDDSCNIVSFVTRKAFNYNDVGSYYKTVNIYKMSKEFSHDHYVPFLNAYCASQGNNEYYEQVLRVVTMLDRVDMKALPIGDKKWYEIDDVQDLDIAETIFSSDKDRLPKYMKRYGGYWRFPNMLDFCYLVNPYFPTPRMKDEMRANFDILLTEYPSGMFVNSLLAGKYFSISQKYVVAGNGASELIKSLMTFTKGKVGIVCPTFEEYPHRSNSEDVVTYVPDNADYRYTAADLKQYFADKNLSALLLINPDNPSGNFIPKAEVLDLATWAEKRNIRLIVDESFVDFSENYAENSLLHDDVLEAHRTMVVMKSISKSYGVPGLRLGVMASGDEALIARMKKDVAIWNINSFAEFYMQIFNKYSVFYNEACRRFLAERSRFQKALETVPYLRVVPSQANYFMCQLTGKYSSSELTQLLLTKYNILIKDCNTKHALEGKNYIRLSVRDSVDNDRLVAALMEL